MDGPSGRSGAACPLGERAVPLPHLELLRDPCALSVPQVSCLARGGKLGEWWESPVLPRRLGGVRGMILLVGQSLCPYCLTVWSRAFHWRQCCVPIPVLGACSEQQSQAPSAGTKPAVNIMCFKLKPFILFIGVITVKQPHEVILLLVGQRLEGAWRLASVACAGPASLGAHFPPLASSSSPHWSSSPLLPPAESVLCQPGQEHMAWSPRPVFQRSL